jgi:hypothetical protein
VISKEPGDVELEALEVSQILKQESFDHEQHSLSRNDSGPGNIQGKLRASEEKIMRNGSSRSFLISPLSSNLD